jgi:putative hydrolase of the HAD superfamily
MQALVDRTGRDEKDMAPLVWRYRKEFDRGTLSGIAYYRAILGPDLAEAEAEALVRLDLDGWKCINTDTVALMGELREQGFLLGVLSNMPLEFLVWAREQAPEFRHLHAGIFSCETGFVKPERPIYEVLLASLSCKAEEVVFFDDIVENVYGACSLGIRGFVWQDVETARRSLRALGVRV